MTTIDRGFKGIYALDNYGNIDEISLKRLLLGKTDDIDRFLINTRVGQFEIIFHPKAVNARRQNIFTVYNVSNAGKGRGKVIGVSISTPNKSTDFTDVIKSELGRFTFSQSGLGELLKEISEYQHRVLYIDEGGRLVEYACTQQYEDSKTYVSYLGDYKPVTSRPKKGVNVATAIRMLMNNQLGNVIGMSNNEFEGAPTTDNIKVSYSDNYEYAKAVNRMRLMQFYPMQKGSNKLYLPTQNGKRPLFVITDDKLRLPEIDEEWVYTGDAPMSAPSLTESMAVSVRWNNATRNERRDMLFRVMPKASTKFLDYEWD